MPLRASRETLRMTGLGQPLGSYYGPEGTDNSTETFANITKVPIGVLRQTVPVSSIQFPVVVLSSHTTALFSLQSKKRYSHLLRNFEVFIF